MTMWTGWREEREMKLEQVMPEWQAASRAVEQELVRWLQVHPKATLSELEDVVSEAVSQ